MSIKLKKNYIPVIIVSVIVSKNLDFPGLPKATETAMWKNQAQYPNKLSVC